MTDTIVIGIKTETYFIPVVVKQGLYDLSPNQWQLLLDRQTEYWNQVLNVTPRPLQREEEDTLQDEAISSELEAELVEEEHEGELSEELAIPGRQPQPTSQSNLASELAGLLGQRLEGIVQVTVNWQVLNAPEESRVSVAVRNQIMHPGPPVGQTYYLAVNQPHEGELTWCVNDYVPVNPTPANV